MALRRVVRLSDDEFTEREAQVVTMARERQHADPDDADHRRHEFWESFDYLDGLGTT